MREGALQNPDAYRLTYVDTHRGQVQVYADCRVEIYDVENEEIEALPSIILPADFTAQQWKALSASERVVSLAADRYRLIQENARLKRRNAEYLIIVVMCIACVVAAGWIVAICMRH